MTFFRRVWDALRPADHPERAGRADTVEPAPGRVAAPLSPEEAYLRALLDRGASAPPSSAPPGLGDEAFWAAVDRLLAAGRERTAIELLERFLVGPAPLVGATVEVAARLVELRCDRLEYAEAVPWLERLLAVRAPAHALRARFLLGEACERAGDLEAARRHYGRVLAADIDYPKARTRHARLGATPVDDVEALPTIFGLEGERAAVTGRYRLRRELGRGGAGAVYLALDEELGREVALKLLHPYGGDRAETRARSFNEARIAAALRHPGVVAIYDLDEERSLIAMELCRGSLRERIARGPLPSVEALRRGAELFDTLAAVHRAGVIHRDLKPGNLLFRAAALDGDADDLVLADFGLADLHGRAAADGDEAPAGTLGYLAPEAQRGEFSPASDAYAAGVILHEMLAGALPFDRASALRGDARFSGALPEPAGRALAKATARADDVVGLIARLLAADPSVRPTATEACALLIS